MPVTRLSLTEWAVLGLVAEGRTHGFAVSRELVRDGAIGRVWTIPRPLVYRAIATLCMRGMLREVGSVTGGSGPPRRLIEVSPGGRAALERWLDEPIGHVRDARSELLIKLLLLERSGKDPRPLLVAQASMLEAVLAVRVEQLRGSEGFDSTLARWRLYSAEAVARFVAELIDEHSRRFSPPPTDRTPSRR
ncbi:MAG TPA: PadR family transcriptional regulator [Acidimicrobiales bacterium]|nr:PadR family transcriptional regulator [Acidimicrobiales bacterium]